jgi:hypothetical protein
MSHATTVRKVFGVTQETIIRRILKSFDLATPAIIEQGSRWYDEAGQIAAEIAADDDSVIHTTEQGAALLAALSPRTSWARNVAGALSLAHGGTAAGCIGTNVERAQRVLANLSDPIGALDTGTAPKVVAFARNIAGDREAVTVDVWACRVADLDENRLTLKGAYDAVAHCYRLAAARRGVDPSTMQATTWIVARNGRHA